MEPFAERRRVGIGQVLEAGADRVRVRAEQRRAPGHVDVIADDHERARPEARVEAAGGVGQHDRPGAEAAHEQDRLDDESRVVALVHVQPALEHDDGHAVETTEEQAADVAGGRGGRPAGQVREGDRDRIGDVVGQAAEARAQHDPDPRDEVAPGPDGGLEGVESGGLIGGRDRGPWVESHRAQRTGGARGVWALRPALHRVKAGAMRGRRGAASDRERDQGEELRLPDGSIDTGMPITSRRAGPTRGGREATGNGQRSARSDRAGLVILDAISVSPVFAGPFGQDLR